ncbi:MAG: hypothetical protein LBT14_11055, partial [Treponema sp.]|nr:hypothetical protein [Treponema sp.]
MYSADKQQFYSPQFSGLAVVSVRRLAWAMGKRMTKVVDQMVRLLPSIVDQEKVCPACQDKSGCKACVFNRQL